MSKLTDELAEHLKIHNPYGFAKVGRARIYVTCDPKVRGRMYGGAQYSVNGIDFKVSPDGPWYDYGDEKFTVFHYGGDKHKARDEAFAWATEKFHIKEWAKMPFRESWVSKDAYDRVMALLKEAKRNAKM